MQLSKVRFGRVYPTSGRVAFLGNTTVHVTQFLGRVCHTKVSKCSGTGNTRVQPGYPSFAYPTKPILATIPVYFQRSLDRRSKSSSERRPCALLKNNQLPVQLVPCNVLRTCSYIHVHTNACAQVLTSVSFPACHVVRKTRTPT